MLDQFRTLAHGTGAKIFLLFLLLMFAVWGIGDMVKPSSRITIASMGGEKIVNFEFQQVLRNETEKLRRAMGDHFSPETLKQIHLPEQVLKRMINDRLLRMESQALGIIPSDADIVRRIRATPAFQDNKGNFDKGRFEAVLRSAGSSEKAYVEQLRSEMASDILQSAVAGPVPVPDAAARTLLAARQEQRALTLYRLSPSLVGEAGTPDDAEAKIYYLAHKGNFTAPEYRTLSYVTITADDVRGEGGVSEATLRAAYQEHSEEFRRPERRTVEQLLYSSEDKAKAAYARLKAGESFAQLAKTSDIINSNALSLGTVERSGVIDQAADLVFALQSGGITEPVQSPFGWHIFHVSAILPPVMQSFEEARPLLERDMKQRGADEALNQRANELEDTLAAGSSLAEAANAHGLKVHSFGPVTREGLLENGSKPADFPPKNITEVDKFMDVAFKTPEKTESPLLTSRGGVYYIIGVDKVTPERLRPLEEVKSQVIVDWQKDQRAQKLAELANQIAQKFAEPATRAAAIAQYKLTPLASVTVRRASHSANDIILPPLLVADGFARAQGGSTGAYSAQDGNYLLAVAGEMIPAPAADAAALAELRNAMAGSVQNELLAQYLRYLADKYNLRVNQTALKAFAGTEP